MFDVTLITSVLNGMPYLDAMLASIPTDARVEHVAIDAGSTDGSRERLAAVDGLRLIDRPGLPLYEAWNEAVAVAQGRYVMFVNADDWLAPNALSNVLAALADNPGADVLAAGARAFVETPQGQTALWNYGGSAITGRAPEALIFGASLINAKLFRRDLILACGGFDTSYAFAADREFLLRLLVRGPEVSWRQMNALLYCYRIHAESKTLQPVPARRVEISLEHQRIAGRYLSDRQVETETADLLRAWLAHEQAVTLLRGAAIGRLDLVRTATGNLVREAPQSVSALLLARRVRRNYRRALLSDAVPSCGQAARRSDA